MEYLFGESGTAATKGRKLQVSVGPSPSHLAVYPPNRDAFPQFIDSPFFTGNVCVRVRGFEGIVPPDADIGPGDERYFEGKKRLFSIQVSGRFKQEYSVDDVVFGAQFEDKVNPPTGAWVAIKFAQLIDPALVTDIYADKPWLLSPMLCSMNVLNVTGLYGEMVSPGKSGASASSGASSYFSFSSQAVNDIPGSRLNRSNASSLAAPSSSSEMTSILLKRVQGNPKHPSAILGPWKWGGPVELEENSALMWNSRSSTGSDRGDSGPPVESNDIAGRRRYFQTKEVREATRFSPDLVYHMEIYAPFIDFNSFDLTLGVNINLLRYLNNQPITLLAKSLSTGHVFFAVQFHLVD